MAFWRFKSRGARTGQDEDIALVAASDLFDRAWYLAQYPDIRAAGTDPALHYTLHGAAEGRDPGPKFSSQAYLERNRDVAEQGLNPLVHYLKSGKAESREIAPSPRALPSAEDDIALIAASDLFDRAWYLAHNEDVAVGGADPVDHYVRHGAAEGRDPGPNFSSNWYAIEHKDVVQRGMNPLAHFLRKGRAEGRMIAPAGSAPGSVAPAVSDDASLITQSELFDRAWYLAQYPDIAEAEVDPAAHYARQGYKEGRDPGPRFSTNWYLREYKDVANLQVNPLVHYLRFGKAEGRAAGPQIPGSAANAVIKAKLAAGSNVLKGPGAGAPPKTPLRPSAPPTARPLPGAVKPPPGKIPPAKVAPVAKIAPPKGVTAPAKPPIVSNPIQVTPKAQPASPPPPAPVSDLVMMAQSEWFDAGWYLAQYPEVAESGLAPAEHYLERGVAEGRDPSPRFSTRWYLAEHRDVASAGLNPLLHYLKSGRNEKREIAPSPRGIGLMAGPAAPPASFAMRRKPAPTAIVWQRDLNAAEPAIELGGLNLATGIAGDDDARTALDVLLSTFRRLARVGSAEPAPSAFSWEAEPGALAATAPTDIWFTGSFDLRLRLRQTADAPFALVRLYQFRPNEPRLLLAGEAVAGQSAAAFASAALANPFCPLLITISDAAGILRAAEIVPFPSLCRGGAHYGETATRTADARYLDGLRALSAELATRLLDLGPGRSGAAIARTAVETAHAMGTEPIFQPAIRDWLGAIMGLTLDDVDPPSDVVAAGFLRGALAAPSWRAEPADGEAPRDNLQHAVLTLPADAIPTISALVAGEDDLPRSLRVAGSLVVADSVTGTPRWSVEMPPGATLVDLQPAGTARDFPVLSWPGEQASEMAPPKAALPLAIRFTDTQPVSEARLVLPASADLPPARLVPATPAVGSITVVVPAYGQPGRAFTGFLEALRLQTVADDIDIIAVGGNKSADREEIRRSLSRIFPGRHMALEHDTELSLSRRINIAASLSESRYLLIAGRLPVLQDPRTLEILRDLSARENVATAACLTIAEIAVGKNRIFEILSGGFNGNPVQGDGGIFEAEFSQPNIHAVFPFATYPVAGNSAGLFMVSAAVWQKLGGFDAAKYPGEGADLDFALRAIESGLTHLCTSVVTATVDVDKPTPIKPIPGLRRSLSPASAEALRAAACIVTELHG